MEEKACDTCKGEGGRVGGLVNEEAHDTCGGKGGGGGG